MDVGLKRHIVSVVILSIISGFVFSNTFSNSFMWDDKKVIVANRHIKSLKNIPYFFTADYWKNYRMWGISRYRPVGVATLALDYSLWKRNPFGYHLTNILFHILNVILVYFIIFKLMALGKREDRFFNAAFVTALLFAVHPIHTEAVTWIKNRFVLLGSLFFLSSLLLFIKYTPNRKVSSYLGAILCFMLSLLSKEIAITLPFMLLLYIIYFLPKDELKGAAINILPFFGLAILYLAFKFSDILKIVSIVYTTKISVYSNILAVLKTFGYYIKLLVAPVNLNAARVLHVPGSFFRPAVLISSLLLLVAAAAAVKMYKKSKNISFAIIWIFLTVIPVSNIIFLYTRPIAEQRLYLPSVGFCFLIALIIGRIRSERAVIAVTIFIALFYSYITVNRNLEWKDPVIFWSKTVKASPRNARAYNNLGIAYYRKGKIKKAIASYKKSIEINPKYARPHDNLGVAYNDMGKIEEAIESFKKAIEIDRKHEDAYNNLGNIYAIIGDNEQAIAFYKKVIKMNPDHAAVNNNLAVLYYYEKKYDLAVKYCDKAIKLGAKANPRFLELLKVYR